MTDREKLIELLCECVSKNMKPQISGNELTIDIAQGNIADNLIANGVTVQEWIPASEPPKKPGEYNVAQKHWLDGHLESKRGKWNGVEWFVDGKESLMVTHWMPLPQPPKGE